MFIFACNGGRFARGVRQKVVHSTARHLGAGCWLPGFQRDHEISHTNRFHTACMRGVERATRRAFPPVDRGTFSRHGLPSLDASLDVLLLSPVLSLSPPPHDHHRDHHHDHPHPPPLMKVGTLDSLMQLSDDLVRIDMLVENMVRKVEKQYQEVAGESPEQLKVSGSGVG